MFALKNKKQNRVVFVLALFFFVSGVFFLTPSIAHGGNIVSDTWDLLTTNPFKTLLYGVFWVVGLIASMAITLFEWAIDPNYISGPSGLLNRESVYILWKFIRDFFNLFFILTLLYTAFTIVFQVAKDYKKTLLSLVLAALFVNFSFPITRVIIDMTNVPMYYFINQIGTTPGANKDILGTFMSASKIQGILVPASDDASGKKIGDMLVSQLIMAIVFLFIFSITLLVLAVLMVVRLIALILLLIFASVGFAASVIPGLESYGKQWWQKLWQYALFGPTSMLMLFIATKFFAEISKDNTAAQFLVKSSAFATTENASFMSSMAMFTIPIIMLWMAIMMASSSAIVGAGVIGGQGQKFLKWAGKKSYNNTLTRSVGAGLKMRAENNKVLKFVTPKYWADSSKQTEERLTARVGEGKAGHTRTVEAQHNKKVAEAEKKMEETRTSESTLRQMMTNPTQHGKEEVEAAVRLLSKKDALRSGQDMTDAIAATNYANSGNSAAQDEKRNELIKKAGGEIYQSGSELATVLASLGNDTKAITALIDKASKNALATMNVATYQSLATNPDIKGRLDSKLKKEGQTQIMLDFETNVNGKSASQAVGDMFDNMSAEEIAKQNDLFTTGGPHWSEAMTYMNDLSTSNLQLYQEIKNKMKTGTSNLFP